MPSDIREEIFGYTKNGEEIIRYCHCYSVEHCGGKRQRSFEINNYVLATNTI